MTRGNKRWAYILTVLMLLSIMIVPLNSSTPARAAATAVNPATAFSDVAQDNLNLPFIVYLSSQGILKGYPDGKFMPENGLTRAEAATVIARAAGLTIAPVTKNSFRDVGSGYWAQATIAAVTQAGYLKGYPDGRFLPDAKLSRAEGITLMLRLSKQTLDGVTLPTLSDVSSKHWAANSISVALSAEMIGLTNDGKSFLPDQAMSRAEMARALGVLLTKDPDLSSRTLTGTVTVKKGQVSLLKAGEKTTQTMSGTFSINQGDLLTTGKDGEADISFPDGSGFLVKPESQMDIVTAKGRAYIKNGGAAGTGIGMLEVNLKQGKVFGALASQGETTTAKTGGLTYDKLASLDDNILAAANTNATKWYVANQQPIKVKVDMPWGVCAVRGTFWNNLVNANGTGSTSLLTGHAEVIGGGQTVALIAGQQTIGTSAGAPPAPPTPMSSTAMTEWTQVAAWAQERAQVIQTNQEIVPAAPATQPVNNITNVITSALQNVGASPISTPGGGGHTTPTTTDTIVVDPNQLGVYSLTDAVQLSTAEYSKDNGALTRKFSVSSITNTDLAYYQLWLKTPSDYLASTSASGSSAQYMPSMPYYMPITAKVSISQPVYVLAKLTNAPENILVKFYKTASGYDDYYFGQPSSPLKAAPYYSYLEYGVMATTSLSNNKLLSLDTKTISGTISLPAGMVAPKNLDIVSTVYGTSSLGKTARAQKLTIPSGNNSVTYKFGVSNNVDSGYIIESYIDPKAGLNLKYLTSADTLVSVIDGSKDNVNLVFQTRDYTKTISGTISLPSGVTAPTGGLALMLYARDNNKSASGMDKDLIYQALTIPANLGTVDYTISVPDTFYNYVNCSIESDVSDLKVLYSTSSSSSVGVSTGNQTDIDITFVSAQLISGNLVIPVTGGLAQDSYIELNCYNTYPSGYSSDIYLPQGQTTIPFQIKIPSYITSFSLEYQLNDSNILGGTNIVGAGWYTSSSDAAVPQDNAEYLVTAGQGKTGINFKLATGDQINGTVSLPTGMNAPVGGLDVLVSAASSVPEYGNYFECWYYMEENTNSIAYSLPVIPDTYDLTFKVGYRWWTDRMSVESTTTDTIDAVIQDYAVLEATDINNNAIGYEDQAISINNAVWSNDLALELTMEHEQLFFKHGDQWFDLLKMSSLADNSSLLTSPVRFTDHYPANADTVVERYQPNTLRDVNTRIAVGDKGFIIDAQNQTGYHRSTQQLNSVAYGGSQFVVAGNNCTLLKASDTDSLIFSPVTSCLSGNLIDVVYSGNGYVALNNNNDLSSSYDGSSWNTFGTIPASGAAINSISADALNHPLKIVAVGTQGTVIFSDNYGYTWATGDTMGKTDNLNDVVYSDDNLGMYIAVGDNGTILQTLDVGSWTTTGDTLGIHDRLNKVAWTGNEFVVVGDNGVIITSENGNDWTKLESGTTRNLYGVGYSPYMSSYVAVGEGGIIVIPVSLGLSSPSLSSAAAPTDTGESVPSTDNKPKSSSKTRR